MRATCETDSHPVGVLAPPFRVTERQTYAYRICGVCGRTQGVAMTRTASAAMTTAAR